MLYLFRRIPPRGLAIFSQFPDHFKHILCRSKAMPHPATAGLRFRIGLRLSLGRDLLFLRWLLIILHVKKSYRQLHSAGHRRPANGNNRLNT
jgi:hypothetical protein